VPDPAILARLEATIRARRGGDPATSHVARLHAGGIERIAQQLGEEAVETVIAALTGDEAKLAAEAADLFFHLLVLLDAKGLSLDHVLAELERREGVSGIAEKAARSGQGHA
jgi:phosphoribosyl-ATP pyrophosphohydrolase